MDAEPKIRFLTRYFAPRRGTQEGNTEVAFHKMRKDGT